ncbi:hypothetical protein M3Y96_00850200 [Aphelenchoides besseyi]|nr:hypothetical protein M3Y96_00850200 [Aphelenchoides besseyi]
MAMDSAGSLPRKKRRPITWPESFQLISPTLLSLLASICLLTVCHADERALRVRREARGAESLLTVEWEGIQSGDHPDSSIRGFIVEYRAEKETQWNVHSGVIPYKGPNHQYRVQIPRLPTGISYFVRIKVLGDKNEVLVETPEIRARNEIVSIKCDGDEITAPRDVDVKERGHYSVALAWQAPECGSVGEYQIELRGLKNERFDVHRMTVAQPSASVTNLLSGTEYVVRIRAVDRSHATSPWNEELITVSTKGDVPEASSDIAAEYRGEHEARIRWKHLDDERLQQYEVVLVEFEDDVAQRIERTRVSSKIDSFHFTELTPGSDYEVGVIAYVDHEPRRIYRLVFTTADQPTVQLEDVPVIVGDNPENYAVHWKAPADELNVERFVVEYKSSNATRWERVSADREAVSGEESYSVDATDLDNAFSVRVMMVGADDRAVAKTKESLVKAHSPRACNGPAGTPTGVKVKPSLNTLTFTWTIPNCLNGAENVVGYEYAIWKKEDGPPETTSFAPEPTVTIEDLTPETLFGFRVRSRLTNGHSPWSSIVESVTTDAPEDESVVSAHDLTSTTGLKLTNAQVQDQESEIRVTWTVTGDAGAVRAYQVEQNADKTENWRPAGSYAPNTPGQNNFKHTIDRSVLIAQQLNLRVRAIGADGNALAYSNVVELKGNCEKIKNSPEQVTLTNSNERQVILRWSFPSQPADCSLYFVISGTIDGASIQQIVNGQSREQKLDVIDPNSASLQISAANKLGVGPVSTTTSLQGSSGLNVGRSVSDNATSTSNLEHKRTRREICDPRTDFWCRTGDQFSAYSEHNRGALISTPSVSQGRNGALEVRWQSQGNGRGVFGYRVLYRSDSTGWNPYGQIVPYVGDNEQYSLDLTSLLIGVPYEIQIQALDRNSYVLYTSQTASAKSSCQPPVQPPSHLTLDAPDARHVRLTWVQPPQSSWHCSNIFYEIQVDEPSSYPVPFRIDGKMTSHVFDSQPDQQWTARVRVANSAGSSPWSSSVSTRAPSASGDLIEGPFVTNVQGVPRLSWRIRPNTSPDSIARFQVEWRSQTEPRWNTHRNTINFAGWQRPYTIDVGDLPSGRHYEVRVKALGSNNSPIFVSPSIALQTSRRCSPPRRPPYNVAVTPLGPAQIRLSWQPLAEAEWNCDSLWYVVKYSSPETQGYRNVSYGENYVVFDSKPYTQWEFEVQAANPGGSSTWSRAQTSQTFSTSPGAISELQIYPTADSVQLSWRPPQNPNGQITGYEVTYQLVSRGMCDNVPDAVQTVMSSGPGYTLSGLKPHSKYRIGVAAKTQIAGERVTREVQTEPSIPTAAPANVRIEHVGDTSAEISWHAPPCVETNGDISEYEYEVSPYDRYSNYQRFTDTIRSTRVQLHNLSPGTKYTFRIRAYTSRGAGPWSLEHQFQTTQRAIPVSAPEARVISTNSTDAHLVWQTTPHNAGYFDKFRCQYAPSGSQAYQQRQFPAYSPCDPDLVRRQQLPPSSPQSITHCGRIDNLRPNQPYDFQVSAKTREGPWSPWSQPQRLQPAQDETVQIMSLTKIGSTTSSLRFGWTVRPTDELRCTAFRITVIPRDRSEAPRTFTVDRNTFQYQVDGLRPNTVYSVTVEASTNARYYPGITVDMSTDAEAMFELRHPPRVIEEKSNSVTIAWDVPGDSRCGSFMVEYRLDNGAWQQYERRVPCEYGRRTYTSTVTGLPTNNVVDLRVVTISPQNQPSAPSPEVRAHTKCSAPDSPPQAVRADAPSANEVRVSWARPAKNTWNCDHLTIEIGYRVGNEPEKIVPVSVDRTDYTFPSEPNSRWVIRVRASNQVGSSPWSAEQTITTRQGAPGAVLNMRLTPLSPNEIRVNWSPPLQQHGTVVGYDISYRLKHRLACPEEEPRDVSRDFVTIYNHKDLEYILTGLLPNSLYEVKVRARTTELGPEETKEAATEQQQPSAPPLNLQLTYALERSLSFQWEPIDCSQRHGEITNYEYEIVGLDDWAKLERQIANTSNLMVTIDGLTPFTKYVMRVKGYNTIGGGPNTENLVVMTAKASAPLPPQDLVVTQEGTDFFAVSWLPPYPPYGPHDKYKLRYQLLNARDWETIEVNSKDPRLECPAISPRFCFNITGLENGQQYRVQVAAHIEGGDYGPYSSIVIANTLQILPDAPRAIELIAKTDHSLHIRWIPPLDPHGHITQYRITYRPESDPNSPLQTVVVDHPKLDQLLDNLLPETTYNISLSAGTQRGFGPEIWTRYATDPFKIPSVLTAPTVTPEGAHTLNVQWTGVSETKNRVAGYIIELRNSDNPVWTESGEIVRHEPGKSQYYSKLTGLDADTLYFVRIKVVDHRQRVGEASPEAQARTGCAAPLAPPSNINLNSPSAWQVRLNWQAPAKNTWLCSAIRYTIEYRNGSQPVKQQSIPSGTEHTFDSAPNTGWTFRVRAENDAGASGWSDELKIKTADGIPGPVKNVDAKPTGPNTVNVKWDEPDNPNGEITGYTITYQLKSIGECGPRSSQPFSVYSKDKQIDLKDLLPDSTYEVHVVAHTSQAGPKSRPVIVKTDEAEPTGQPRNLRASSVTSTRAELSWNDIECELRHGKILGYTYELEALSPYGQNTTDKSTTNRVSLDQLAPFTQYRARVRGYNSQGDGPFSEWVTFQTLPAAPPAPTDLRKEEALPNAIEISFRPPEPPNGVIDTYRIRHTPTGQHNYKDVRVPAFELQCSDANKRDRLCYRVAKLEPETEYEIAVSAHTERGDWGDYSEPLFATTEKINIPVLEYGLELESVKSTSIGVKWKGLEPEQAEFIVGYVLEYKSEHDDEWQEHNGVVRHRPRNNEYKATVRNLIESTEYFFRLRVVAKNDKRGGPSPELKAMTKCGRPENPPSNVQLQQVDFETIKITWENPEKETWKCDDVVFQIQYSNTTSQGTIEVPSDAPEELILNTNPGTKWNAKMRTQTVEEGEEPQHSRWSNPATLTTQSLPNEFFVHVEPKSPTTAEVTWDLLDKDEGWDYGVDIAYKLIKLGGCNPKEFEEQEPIVREDVHDKTILLDGLAPGSEYEVTVTARRPPNLPSDFKPKSTVRYFKTEDATPTGPPQNLRVDGRFNTKLAYSWEPPECTEQNGPISQYEYKITGLEEWNEGVREGVSPRTKTEVNELMPGSLYRFEVRAFTSAGPGPWSEPVDARTTGSELGPPRELTAISTKPKAIQLTWLPPHPVGPTVVAYKVQYSPRADNSNPVEVEFPSNELSCDGYSSPMLTPENLCTEVTGLQPATTYRFKVQAQAGSGNWGPWSTEFFSTTKDANIGPLNGSLTLLSAGHDNLKVKWTPPAVVSDEIDKYEVFISRPKENARSYSTPGSQTEYHFRNLQPNTLYNVTVRGWNNKTPVWLISGNFATTIKVEPFPEWLGPPTDLRLIEKSENMLHVTWEPPEIFDPKYRDLLTHYRVTIAPLDSQNWQQGQPKNYTVPVPGTRIRFDDLRPETVYNITVEGGTESGYGEMIWGAFSTLPVGHQHILKLRHRTPTTLTVEWEPVWGTSHKGYILTAKALTSIYPNVRLNTIKTFDVSPTSTEFVIRDLDPATTYNVTLLLKDQNNGAWGVWSTLPPGWFVPRNLRYCDQTNYAVSMSWEPVELNMATHYQVRYVHLHNVQHLTWREEPDRHRKDLLCPRDPCNRLCYLVFNLENHPDEYAFQVRAKVNGVWNRWKTTARLAVAEPKEVKENCCIVPPPYMVENIGGPDTYWEVPIAPAPTEKNLTRYYVVVDTRDPPGDTNWTFLTDKVTADNQKLPYYVAASFNTETLTHPTTVRIGDGQVIGGYLNYPLVKGHTYNYEIYTKWNLRDYQPVIGRIRASPYVASRWPWWWLALALALLLLLILLCCCLPLWCLRRRKRVRERRWMNGQEPLLRGSKEEYEYRQRGDFEEGYRHGYGDAGHLGSGAAARERMDHEYGSRTDRFHEGYAKAIRDAGLSGITSSTYNLANRPNREGYSTGYMQGFRDGNSGVFGDRITNSLLKRLEDQYPNNDEFVQGYVDGFKDGANGGGRSFEESRHIQKSLTELTERLTTLEKTKGDEIHSTKIYHVYNQHPDFVGYTSTGQQLANELEELASSSRRSTLRRHYTPGDYMRYASELDGYNSLGRNRRSLSASALGRDATSTTADRQRHTSGASASYMSRTSGLEQQISDTYSSSRRYNYRSRSDVESPRRYASQTLLDGARPGPLTPHARRDALHSLQRELDSLSRSPDATRSPGYASDTGYLNDTARTRSRTGGGFSNIDYDSFQTHHSEHRTGGSALNVAESSSAFGRDANIGESSSLLQRHGRGEESTSEGLREQVEERYQRHYKEEYSSGGQQQSSAQTHLSQP